jgi:hypothetical protein
MTDYHPLIARAVEGLDKSSGEARRALYERARTALVTQLRAVEPPLSESEITKERLALEDAIRKVEADAARKSRAELQEPRLAATAPPRRDATRLEPKRTEPVAPKQNPGAPAESEAPRPGPPPTARERLLGARSPTSSSREGVRDFRGVVGEVNALEGAAAKAAQSARDTRDSYAPPTSQHHPTADQTTAFNDYGLDGGDEDLNAAPYETRHSRSREPSYDLHDDQQELHPAGQPSHARDHEHREPRPPRSYRRLAKLVVTLVILAGLLATISWQWPRISGAYHYLAQIGSRQPSQTTRETTSQPKFSGRVPQEQSTQAPSASAPGSQTAPAVAQRVVLYEEDSNDPQGKRYVGSVIWRTETVSPGNGLAPELAVRADVTIPERRITMTWSLRRNTDKALPASHTVEIMFNLPADFSGGGVANVPGILMKQSEQARGTPLAGLAVKVTNGFFLIGLSAVDTDVQRNIELLKERPWFDVPIVYANGGRAILAMEKGPPGDRAFAEAFDAWEKK